MADMGMYKLVDHQPVPVEDTIEWAEWLGENHRERRVKHTKKFGGHVRISTVFLGLDHGFPRNRDAPLVFETMIFGGALSRCMWRYRSWDAAVAGHKSAVRRARG